MKTLRKGDRNLDVNRLQSLLNRKLQPSPHLKVDGIFGPKTEAAVRAFQGQHHLAVDGIVGTNTWGALTNTATPGTPRPIGHPHVTIASGANRPGATLSTKLLSLLNQVAAVYGGTIKVTCGTNHNQYTTDGNISDHWAGNGADIAVAIDSPTGDAIAAAALEVAGAPHDDALRMARRGGLYNRNHGGHRIQIIWKTNQGGNHHNHVHIGIK